MFEKISWDKYTVLLIVIILAFASMQYVRLTYIINSAPEGYVFGYGQEQVVFFAAMNAYHWNYKMPYGRTDLSYFQNSWIGSVYLFAFVGIFTEFLPVTVDFVYNFFNYIFSIVYLAVIYFLMKEFIKDRKKSITGLLFYMIASSGIGGILYFFFKAPLQNLNPDVFLHILGRGGIPVINGSLHWVSALTFLYMSMIFYHRFLQNNSRKTLLLYILSAGLSILIYPIFGLAAIAVIFVHSIIYKKYFLVPVIIVTAGLFAAPWIIFTSPDAASLYLLSGEYVNIIAFLLLGIFLIPLALIFILHYVKNGTYRNHTTTFLLIWLIVITLLALTPPEIPLPVNTQRYINMLFVPWAAAAVLGLGSLNLQRFRLKESHKKYVYASVILLTLPTLAVWYIEDTATMGPYFAQKDVDALMFLRSQPQGVVLASHVRAVSSRIPYWAEKQAMSGGGITFGASPFVKPVTDDYYTFYSENSTAEEKYEVLKRNRIKYVIYGISPPVEVTDSQILPPDRFVNAAPENPEIERNADPTKIPGLSKIYDQNSVSIYEFSG